MQVVTWQGATGPGKVSGEGVQGQQLAVGGAGEGGEAGGKVVEEGEGIDLRYDSADVGNQERVGVGTDGDAQEEEQPGSTDAVGGDGGGGGSEDVVAGVVENGQQRAGAPGDDVSDGMQATVNASVDKSNNDINNSNSLANGTYIQQIGGEGLAAKGGKAESEVVVQVGLLGGCEDGVGAQVGDVVQMVDCNGGGEGLCK